MKKVYWIKPVILAGIIILFATNCRKEEQSSLYKSDLISESDSISIPDSDSITPGEPPYIWQQHVLDATTSTVTLCAGIKTFNLPTVVYFKYGTQCAAYKDSVIGTIRTDCCNDSTISYFEYVATITGLKPGTDYYWSEVATNSFGTSPGGCNYCCTMPGGFRRRQIDSGSDKRRTSFSNIKRNC